MPNKLSQFWQELKRRKVIKAIAMYAGGAYVLIELANNVVVPLNLPDWTPRLVILFALVGFPIIVVLSWIFDITPEGIDKTESIEEAGQQEQTPLPGKRKLKPSDVIIIVLIVFVGILAYPRISGSGNLNAMTVPVTVVNEFGERETRRVFKEDYLTKLALFPFNNEIEDSSENWMGWGIMEAVLEDQRQFSNILVDRDGSSRLNEQIAFAQEGRYPYFLTGTYREEGPKIEIISRLYQTSNGAVEIERIYRGTDFFSLVDSICFQVRKDLGISEIILEATPDLPISDLLTDHLDAYKFYIQGRYFWHFDSGRYAPLYKAVQIDSTFALASRWLAYWCYNYQGSHESARRNIQQAIRHRSRLSEFSEIETRILHYMILEDRENVIKLSKFQYELRPRDFNLLSNLYLIYMKLGLVDRAESVAERLTNIVPDHPPYQIRLAETYLRTEKPDRSLDVLNVILDKNPENVEALLKMGEAYLHENKLEAAEEAFNKAIWLMPEQKKHWANLLNHITHVRNIDNLEETLELFINTVRSEHSEFSAETYKIRDQLFYKPYNQMGLFFYPVSDTVLVSAFKNGDTFDFVKSTYILSGREKGIGETGEQWSGSGYGSEFYWIEDSLILEAKDLLAAGQPLEALAAFREAYNQNPQHYYLANYIQHLEFILGPDHKTARSIFSSNARPYGDLIIYINNDRIYYTDYQGLTYELLPLSEERFMVPSIYELQVQVVKEQNVVAGLKFLHWDGTEEFFPRSKE